METPQELLDRISQPLHSGAMTPQCPHCKAQLAHLVAVVSERREYTYTKQAWGDCIEVLEQDIDFWACPECYVTLSLDPSEESALQFLEGDPLAVQWEDQ